MAIEVSRDREQRPMPEITGLRERFGAVEVLRDVSLAVSPEEVVLVIGPSGSGKTTLLRCTSLLEECEHGTIMIYGQPIGYRIEEGKPDQLLFAPQTERVRAFLKRYNDRYRI
jgi:ABC-type histidine transport system ATPase subunit